MVIVRNKSGKLVEVYAGISEYMDSPDYMYHMDDRYYDKVQKWPADLTPEERQKATPS